VVIGQVEVVVVSEGRGTGERGGDRGAGRSGSFLSRNYLRRL
jgi:hypothetical protein